MKHLPFLIIALYSLDVLILVFLLIFPLFYNYRQFSKTNPTIQAKEIIAKVAKLVALPEGENPREIGIINDKEKLKNDPFFDEAQKGDIILIYPHAQEVILYNLKSNKIINIGPYIEKAATATALSPETNLNHAIFIKPLETPAVTPLP